MSIVSHGGDSCNCLRANPREMPEHTGPKTKMPVGLGKHSPKQYAKRPTSALMTRTNQALALFLTSLGRPIRGLLNSWGLLNNSGSRNRDFFLRRREGRRRNDSWILNSRALYISKNGVTNSGGISEHRNVRVYQSSFCPHRLLDGHSTWR